MRKEVPPFYDLDALRIPNLAYRYLERADLYPFRPAAQGFDLVNAWWLSEIAYLDYVDDPIFVRSGLEAAGFCDIRFFDRDGTHCTVAANDEIIVVSFRGTEFKDARDVVADLRVRPVPFSTGGMVHRGYNEAWLRVARPVLLHLRAIKTTQTVWFTGHSLGAAVATLGAIAYGETSALYTFGSPRVGLYSFAVQFDVPAFRVVHADDLAVHLPPAGVHTWATAERYTHVGDAYLIDRAGQIEYDPDPESWISRTTRLARALRPIGVIDHLAVYYAVKLWNAVVECERVSLRGAARGRDQRGVRT